jgi:Flp pilus assembly protein TadD
MNTFSNGFVFDDEFFIVNNFEIRSLKNIPSFFVESSVGNLYRPIRGVLYSFTYLIWKLNPFGWHLNAILFHAIITVVVYLILVEILPKYAFFTSLLFLAHPIHTARVANMTAGFDLLGIFFLFLAFYNYIIFRARNEKKFLFYSLVIFVLGLFSSEEAISLLFLVILYDICFFKDKIKKSFKAYSIYFILFVFYFLIRYSVLRQVGRAGVYFLGDIQTRILSTLVIFSRYILIILFPFKLTVDYNVVPYDHFSLPVVASVLLLSIIIFLGVWLFRFKGHKIVCFAIGWFFVVLLPFSNLLPVNSFMNDRYLYVASFGFIVLLAYLGGMFFNRFKDSKKIASLVFISIFICYSGFSVVRNSEWDSDILLLSMAVQRQPKSSIAYNDLGMAYQENQDYDFAFLEYQEAINLNKNNHVAWLNKGTLLGEVGNYSSAVYYIDRSLSIRESYKGYNNLGLIYYNLGDVENSIIYLIKAIEFNPFLSKAYMDLGVVYAQEGRLDEAIDLLNKALQINPNNKDVQYNLDILYSRLI